MKRLFTLAAAAVLFGTGIVGCSNTAEGAKEDASKDAKAVTDTAGAVVDKTVQGTAKAAAATEKGVATAAAVTENAAASAVDATKEAASKTVAATEKGVATAAAVTANAAATAADATKKAADKTVAAAAHATEKAGEVATHAGKVLTATPTVKAALLTDKTIYPTADASKINVNTDSDGVTVHLKGTVPSNEAKKKATEVATAALAGGSTQYKISNELTVAAH